MRKKKEQLEEPIPQNYKSPVYNVIAVPVE